MDTVPFSPLTADELRDRYRSAALACVGALNWWAEYGYGDRPDVAIDYAREASALLDAAAAR